MSMFDEAVWQRIEEEGGLDRVLGDSRLTMLGVDPDYINDPDEFEMWTHNLIEMQMKMRQDARSSEGQARLRKWIDAPLYVMDDQGNAATGTPPNIVQRFPRLVKQSLDGELYASTALMMDEATDRASVLDYAWLHETEVPSRSGIIYLPANIWPTTEKRGYDDKRSWVHAISWMMSPLAVTVCWWEAEVWTRDVSASGQIPLGVGLFHTWSMKFDGEKRWGRLHKPKDDSNLSKSFWFIASGCELIKMLQEVIETTRPFTPRPPKALKRQIKKEYGGKIPSVRIYDLRRRVNRPTGQPDRTGQGSGRTLKYRRPIRGHPRTLYEGTPEERVVWVTGSVQGKHLPPHPNERQHRLGLLKK